MNVNGFVEPLVISLVALPSFALSLGLQILGVVALVYLIKALRIYIRNNM